MEVCQRRFHSLNAMAFNDGPAGHIVCAVCVCQLPGQFRLLRPFGWFGPLFEFTKIPPAKNVCGEPSHDCARSLCVRKLNRSDRRNNTVIGHPIAFRNSPVWYTWKRSRLWKQCIRHSGSTCLYIRKSSCFLRHTSNAARKNKYFKDPHILPKYMVSLQLCGVRGRFLHITRWK